MGAITSGFAEFVSKTGFDDLPDSVVHEMKRVILDTIGCGILGHSTMKGRIAAALAEKLGGNSEATILGTSNKVSSANAAFANGELMNSLDFDAVSQKGRHDVPTVLAAQLAVSESTNASGKDLILSTAIAFEISARIKSAVGSMTTTGSSSEKIPFPEVSAIAEGAPLGAAMGAGKLLNLTPEMLANAIGIAGYILPPSVMRKELETTPVRMTKYCPMGWGAQAGVTAALLAEMGYTGDTDLFVGDYGFWRYTGKKKGEWSTENVLVGLGKEWSADEMTYKQYPAGY